MKTEQPTTKTAIKAAMAFVLVTSFALTLFSAWLVDKTMSFQDSQAMFVLALVAGAMTISAVSAFTNAR